MYIRTSNVRCKAKQQDRTRGNEVRTRAYSRLKGRIYIGKPCTEPKMEGERISGKWPDEWRRGETFETQGSQAYITCACVKQTYTYVRTGKVRKRIKVRKRTEIPCTAVMMHRHPSGQVSTVAGHASERAQCGASSNATESFPTPVGLTAF